MYELEATTFIEGVTIKGSDGKQRKVLTAVGIK